MNAIEQLAYDRLTARLTTAETNLTDLRAQLAAAQRELADVKAKSATADSRAREQLAAKGIPPVPKDTPANLETLAGGDAALCERYQAASPLEKMRMQDEYGDKLTRAAEAYDRRG